MKKKTYRSFTEARKFVHKLELKNRDEWSVFCKSGKKPDDIPSIPAWVYKNKGWVSVGDWLGTGRIATGNRKFRPFKEARKFAQALGLKTRKEWTAYTKSDEFPYDIPTVPESTYKNKGWVSNGDWLGTGTVATFEREYRQFQQARKFARSLKFKSRKGWEEYKKSGKKPGDIPATPHDVYKNKGWEGMGDFLGTGRIANQNIVFLSAKEARIEIRKITKDVFGGKPFTEIDWINAHKVGKIPKNLPRYLHSIYNPNSSRNKRMKREKK